MTAFPDHSSSSFPQITNRFKGRSVLAADGCHVVYSTNAEIIEDFKKPRLIDHKGYNHMHLNGFVDVFSKAFLDAHPEILAEVDRKVREHYNLDPDGAFQADEVPAETADDQD